MSLIRGALLAGKFRKQSDLNEMSHDSQRNTLIFELATRSGQQPNLQGLDDAPLAGAGAVFVFLRAAGIRDDAALRRMTADDQRNTLIVEMAAQTGLPISHLQGMSSMDLVLLGLGNNLPGSLAPSSFLRGVLLAGKFRRHQDLNKMSHDDQRNTLIVELTSRSNQDNFQSFDDFALAGMGAVLVFLRETGIRDDRGLKAMTADDQRNTLIVEMDAQTGLGSRLQGLTSMDLVRVALGVDPAQLLKPLPPPLEHPRSPGKRKGGDNGRDNPELGDEHGNVEPGCFVGDTPVLMADGLTRPIDAIEVGDQVMARDESTGAAGICAVSHVFRHHVNETLLLEVQGGEVIETTAVHRFAAEAQGFVGAGELRPGDRLSTRDDRGAEVLSTAPRAAASTVYNLSVDRFHTFFVGGSGLWVHNKKKAEPHEREEPLPSP